MLKLFSLLTVATLTLTAQTFNVSTTPELRTALETAATNGEDDTIVLADGTYKTTDDGGGTFIYLSNEANLLTLIGSNSENVILSGDSQYQIFNHISTVSAPMQLEKLSFVNGYSSSQDGGGVFTDYSIKIIDCNFTGNNATFDASPFNDGGAFYSSGKSATIDIENSTFTQNNAYSGGAFSNYAYSSVSVKNSLFTNNSSKGNGGAINSANSNVNIENTIFKYNTASNGSGGAVYTYSSVRLTKITNSIFHHNSANSNYGIGSVKAVYMKLSNSLFYSNSAGISYGDGDDSIISNSIFIDNNNIDIDSYYASTIVTVNNNYIDENNIHISSFKSGNIFDGVTLGFVDEANGDYNLTASSDLVDAGTPTPSITLPDTDLGGNARLVGGAVDIGPYEFSTTKPTINSFTYSGTAKELNELTFSVDYNLTDGRSISEVAYDYANDGAYGTVETYTFDTAGTYTVNVKVTDSAGEFSTTSLNIIVVPLPFAEMTDEQKLVKAIDSIYYDDIIAIINSEKDSANASGVTTGENNVVLSPSTYGLFTEADINSSVATATAAGDATGRAYVQTNPAEFALVTQAALDEAVVAAKQYVLNNLSEFSLIKEPIKQTIDVTNSWQMVGVLSDINDISVFNDSCVDIIWQYKDDIWKAHSTDTTVQQTITNLGYSGLTSIKKSEAFWIHGTGSCEVQTFIDNKPTVSITGAKSLYHTSETLSLDATGSSDDGSIVSYSWKLNGSVVSTDAKLSNSSLFSGTNTVTLDVTDDFGQVSSKSLNIQAISSFTNLLPMDETGSMKSISSFSNGGATTVTLSSGSQLYFKIINDTDINYTVSQFKIVSTYNGVSTTRASSTDATLLSGGTLNAGENINLGYALTSSQTANYWVGTYTLTDVATGIEFTNNFTWNGTSY